MPARGWWWKSREEEREREKWWAVRKRGHGCHAPRVKPTINREVKLLRYSLVHRSLAFARKSLHLSLCAKQPPPSFPWKYISVFPFPFFFFFFFSLSTNLPRIYLPIPKADGEETRSKRGAGIEFQCAQCINASKSDKARFRFPGFIVSQPRRTIGARPPWKRRKRNIEEEKERFITLFEACLSTADSARGSWWMCFISSHATLLPQQGRKGGRRKEGGEAKGWSKKTGERRGKKLRRRAVMDWPGPITSFVSICAEYCS